MAYLEKDFETDYLKWERVYFRASKEHELKCTKGGSIAFNAVVPHQVTALYNAAHSCINMKLPDCGFQNPFDGVMICETPAYVGLMFYAKNAEFFMIDIDTWIKEKEQSKRKSITEDRAREIGLTCNFKTGEIQHPKKR